MTITGHEEEFRRLFEQEAGTRLSQLAERAMELESGGADRGLVTEMFRDAHTLKGGAAVVGFAEVAAVVHELEQLLEELRSGAREPDTALVDGVLVTVDAVREMVDCAMAGADAGQASATALDAIEAARQGRRVARTDDEAARAGDGEPQAAREKPERRDPAPAPAYAAERRDTREGRGADGHGHAAASAPRGEERKRPEGPDDELASRDRSDVARGYELAWHATSQVPGDEPARRDTPEPPGDEPAQRETPEAPGDEPARSVTPEAAGGEPAPEAPGDEPERRPDASRHAGASADAGGEPHASADPPLPALRTAHPPGTGPGPAPRPAGEAIPVPVGRLDELVRLVGESAAALLRIGRLLAERLGDEPDMVDEYRELARVLRQLQDRTMRARMVSVATVAAPLRRAVRDIARASGKRVRWELAGEDTELDRHVLEQLREPLVALVRNATDHGIESPAERAASGKPEEAVVRVHAMQIGADVVIAVGDDGRGIDVARVQASAGRRLSDAEALRVIFEPGLTTAERVSGVSGRGVGLDAVRSAVDALRGRVEVRTEPGRGTEFRITVPMTLAVLRCLLVRSGARAYALPMHSTATALPAPARAVVSAEGRPALMLDGDAIGFSLLGDVLGTAREAVDGRRDAPAAVVLATASGRHAFQVDELLGQRDVVVKDLGQLLPRLPLVAGASVEPDGGIMLVLDPDGLILAARSAPGTTAEPAAPPAPAELPRPAARLLVVDDALTIRELQRSILQRAGYDVGTAGDGEEALRALAERPADLVVCDVEMPGMDGFTLTREIRSTPELAATPVLILTSLGDDADRRRGMEAGADGYLVKSAFDEHTLLSAVRRLLGHGTDA